MHWRTPHVVPVPADFIPLRLVLQPSGATVELTQPDVLIGRHSQADVRLPLPERQPSPLPIPFRAGVWQVLDLNSLNGVFLNDRPVRQATIQQGDLLRIGGFTFAVDLIGSNQQVTPADAGRELISGIFKTLPAPTQGNEHHRRAS